MINCFCTGIKSFIFRIFWISNKKISKTFCFLTSFSALEIELNLLPSVVNIFFEWFHKHSSPCYLILNIFYREPAFWLSEKQTQKLWVKVNVAENLKGVLLFKARLKLLSIEMFSKVRCSLVDGIPSRNGTWAKLELFHFRYPCHQKTKTFNL